MNNRLELHEILCKILGSRNVYYQPTESVRLKYPCIIYRRSDIDNINADNLPYVRTHEYQIIVVDKNPDSRFVEDISKFPMCRFDRHYTADNLNHDIFVLYF